ncbi:MAG: 5'-methylthioadenosine/S-adenosylhomocysteine nucleosidase [Gemmatimonadales bacterium]
MLVLTAVVTITASAAAQGPPAGPRPVLVQGAMQLETALLVSRLEEVKVDKVAAWTFWRGTLEGYPVIVSKTLKGTANAAAATALAIERYHPIAIVNQGTAGGHDSTLHVYHIVLGTSAVNLGAFKTPHRGAGTGSNALDWVPLDLLVSEGSAGNDPNEHQVARFQGDSALLAAARSAKHRYTKGRIVEGVIGSSDIWNEEIDRIARLRAASGTSVEEMETASAGQIAGPFKVPFLGIRVVSNNITSGGAYDPKTGEACQDFVFQVLIAYVATLRR